MIEKIIELKGVGVFHNALPHGARELNRITLIYAENGRGKTTFSEILGSLAKNDDSPIKTKKTLVSDATKQKIHLRINGQSYIYDEHGWNGYFEDILIFNSHFIESNVYIGSKVEAYQRENLFEFFIGSESVNLKEQIDEINEKIEEINKKKLPLEKQLERIATPYTIKDFLDLTPPANLDEKIEVIRRRLNDVKEIENIKSRPMPQIINFPRVDMKKLKYLLSTSLDSLSVEAERKVKEHIKNNFRDAREGREWIYQGLSHLQNSTKKICPFCGQSLEGIELVELYKKFFNERYREFRKQIEDFSRKITEQFGKSNWGNIQKDLESNKSTIEWWQNSLPPDFSKKLSSLATSLPDTKDLETAFKELGDHLVDLFARKEKGIEKAFETSIYLDEVSQQYAEKVDQYNNLIRQIIELLQAYKDSLERTNSEELSIELQRLKAQKRRMELDIVGLCDNYRKLLGEKRELEKAKKKKREDLNKFMNRMFEKFEEEINDLLNKFGTAFRIGEIKPSHRKGTPRTEYTLELMNTKIPVASSKSAPPHHFGTVLSESDKRTLAFAFFLAKLYLDPKLNQKIVVIDDPISSFDSARRTATRYELVGLSERCKQLIVLSHDALFLRDLFNHLNYKFKDDEVLTLEIKRAKDFSVITGCDIYQKTREKYYKTYEALLSYIEHGPNDNLEQIAAHIRYYLEYVLRVRFPLKFEKAKNLGHMISIIRDNQQHFGKFANQLEELEKLNDFSSSYHHPENSSNVFHPTPSDSEILNMVKLALKIGQGI